MVRRSNYAAGFLVLLVLTITAWGCSPTEYMIKSMDPLMAGMSASVNGNPDVDMVRDALPATLIQIDGFIKTAPNPTLLLRASEAYFGYTFAFVQDADRRRASMLYLKAREYALRAFVLKGNSREIFAQGINAVRAALSEFDREDVPALYWIANNWMAWIAVNLDDPEVLLDIPKVEAILLRIVELDESYYYGSAHAALGAYYASRSKVLGGNPQKAKYHFDRAFELSESKLLFVHLLYAQYYAYQIQDRELFEKTLNRIIATPVDYFPEKNFTNEISKRKAQALLEAIDEYF